MSTGFQLTFDCVDADAMCTFWSLALDYVVEAPPDGHATWAEFLTANGLAVPPTGSIGAIVDPAGIGPRMLFLRVPERKTVKNRLHLDLRSGGGDDAKQAMVARLTAAGATTLRRVDEQDDWWMVMTDPEGNEFCVT